MRFDLDKAIEVLLYIAQSVDRIEQLLVTVYVADKMHLERYGRLIYGEIYVTASLGMRPMLMRGLLEAQVAPIAFKLPDWSRVIPVRKPELDLLSESDVQCLDDAIQECMDDWLTTGQDAVFEESHGVTKLITYEDIAKTLPNAELLLDHLRYE